MPEFKDFFSKLAQDYARHRPRYPGELFQFLASLCSERKLAWDCGTGNGQAAAALADFFDDVRATDASEKQIQNALPHPKVRYAVEPAAKTSLPSQSADLAIAAQALHWFANDEFYAEVRRVLKSRGVFAAWAYADSRSGRPELDLVLRRFAYETLGPYWAPENKLIWDGYKNIPFPFEEIAAPPFSIRTSWSLDQLLGYLSSWSAVPRCAEATGANPLIGLRAELAPLWGNPDEPIAFAADLALRAGRIL